MLTLGPLLPLAIVLTIGLIGGEIAARLRLPRVTGWILTGVGLRAVDLPILGAERLDDYRPFFDFVLGFIAFTVGSHLQVRSLINAQWRLLFLVVTELIVTPLIVIAFMCGIGGLSLAYGLLFAAIAAAGAPGTTVLVVREARARGVFVKTLLGAVALIDMVAVCLFVAIETELGSGDGVTVNMLVEAAPAVGRTLVTAIAIGLACAVVITVLTRKVVGSRRLGAVLIAAILLAWGVAEWADVSSILAVTFLGAALANLMPDRERVGENYLNTFSEVLFTAFYTLAGMRLQFGQVVPMAGLIAIFFVGRFVGKSVSAFIAMTLARAPSRMPWYLGPALIPHGGVAVGLIVIVQNDPALAPFSETVLAVGLSALAINQFVGPSITKWALERVQETNQDRPRLLDFIREQDIIVNLDAPDAEAALTTLVDHLFKTHDVQSEKDEFLASIVQRDTMDLWFLGEGLMIPHGRVRMGDEVAGVLGLSAKGLDFDAPDGRPIHAVLVLATPDSQRDRHIEILAAFARAIAHDRDTRDLLYHSRTAAHAYDILHSEDSEDFNYFLEDALESGPRKSA